MKILYIANGGFGDASWSTSWPRIWSEKGHEVDVFLMKHSGNPFHANPFIKNMFVEEKMEGVKKIEAVVDDHSYDLILIPDNTCDGVQEVIEVLIDFKNMKNVYLFNGHSRPTETFSMEEQHQIVASGFKIPPIIKPEWYFTKEELKYVEDLDLKNSVLFHPLSSSTYEESRNIDFDLIVECSKKIENIVILYGGRKYLPIDDLKRMEASGIRLLWEDYNCFNDEAGSALGKFLALTSLCRVGIHGWSGSANLSQGYNKPYVIVVPGHEIRANRGSPYIDSKLLYKQSIHRAENYGCLHPSAWCITNQAEVVVEAVDHVLAEKTGVYDKEWIFK